jgi:hypothetical protein
MAGRKSHPPKRRQEISVGIASSPRPKLPSKNVSRTDKLLIVFCFMDILLYFTLLVLSQNFNFRHIGRHHVGCVGGFLGVLFHSALQGFLWVRSCFHDFGTSRLLNDQKFVRALVYKFLVIMNFMITLIPTGGFPTSIHSSHTKRKCNHRAQIPS